MTTFDNCPFSVKNIKTFSGMEGTGYECTLYYQGKRVATVTDDATGGECIWHWFDRSAEKPLDDFAAGLAPDTSYGSPIAYNTDMVVEELVNLADAEKAVRRVLAKEFLYVKADPKGDHIRSFRFKGAKVADIPAADVARAKEKYGVTTLINEMPFPEAVKVLRSHGLL